MNQPMLWPVLCCVLLASCSTGSDETPGGSRDDAGTDAAVEDGPNSIDVVTYNLALAPSVRGAKERVPYLAEALSNTRADVLCLQEAFRNDSSPAMFAKLLKDKFPHAYFTDEKSTTALGNGLVIASKWPLSETRYFTYEGIETGELVDRAALAADFDVQGRTFRVVCSHLTAGLAEEGKAFRRSQIEQLIAWVDQLPKVDGPEFWLGDFNAGPDPISACTPQTVPACEPPDLTSYERVLESFEDPNADLLACTQCRDVFYPLQVFSTFENEPDQRIDHCFVRKLAPYAHAGSEVLFSEKVSIPTTSDPVETLSDHLGVRCSFERK